MSLLTFDPPSLVIEEYERNEYYLKQIVVSNPTKSVHKVLIIPPVSKEFKLLTSETSFSLAPGLSKHLKVKAAVLI